MTRERFGLSDVRYARVAFKPTFPRCLWLPPENLLLNRSPVKWNPCLAADPSRRKPLNPGLQPVQAVLLPLVDLGVWFSPRLSLPHGSLLSGHRNGRPLKACGL
jgi:hypothetical protein